MGGYDVFSDEEGFVKDVDVLGWLVLVDGMCGEGEAIGYCAASRGAVVGGGGATGMLDRGGKL